MNGPSIPDIETTYLFVLIHFPGFWGAKIGVGGIGFCSGSAQEMYRDVEKIFSLRRVLANGPLIDYFENMEW